MHTKSLPNHSPKFGALVLRHPDLTTYPYNLISEDNHYKLTVERLFTNANSMDSFEVGVTDPDILKTRLNPGSIVYLTPKRDRLITLANNDTDVAELLEDQERGDDISWKDINNLVTFLAQEDGAKWKRAITSRGVPAQNADQVIDKLKDLLNLSDKEQDRSRFVWIG